MNSGHAPSKMDSPLGSRTAPEPAQPVRVEVYSSYAYAVEPRTFEHESCIHRVARITRSWRTPSHIHFYVWDENDKFFELTYDVTQDRWTLRKFGETCPPRE